MLKRKSFLRWGGILIILLMSFSLLYAQADIWSIRDGDWSDPGTWNLNRIPGLWDWVLVSAGDEVRLDRDVGPFPLFDQIDVDGLLYPEVQPDHVPPVVFGAGIRIQIGAEGRILGYDPANLRAQFPKSTGVSIPILLSAETVNNFGEIRGGNSFQGIWGQAWWASPPSMIVIGISGGQQPLPQTSNFNNTGTVAAGSGVMGENCSIMGGLVDIIVSDNVQNNGGTIRAGDGWADSTQIPPLLGQGGDVIMWSWSEPFFGVHIINGDGGQIIGGRDMGPTDSFRVDSNFTNFLWVVGGDGPGDNISFTGAGTRIDQFGMVFIRSYNPEPITTISLSALDPWSIYARRHYWCIDHALPEPANGAWMWIDYQPASWVDMTGNPAGDNVLVSEDSLPGGEPPFIRFEHMAEPANVLLDDGVTLNSICDPDPIFWGARQSETFSVGRLYPGLQDVSAMSEPYLVPGLGFPGDTAYVWVQFINVGERRDFHIQINDELGYDYWPYNVWVDSTDTPDTTFMVSFRIPYSDIVGTTNDVWITSATYPDGELADSMHWRVIVVPPVKVYPEGDFCGEPGNTDTLSVIVRNHSEFAENFDVYRSSESWYVYPGYHSVWIPGHDADTVEFYIEIPYGAQPGDSNWVAFRASIYGGRDDFWDSDTTMVSVSTIPAPFGLVITMSGVDIILAWNPVSGEPSYNVYESSDSPEGPWSPLATTSDTSYTHEGATGNTKLFYYVTTYSP